MQLEPVDGHLQMGAHDSMDNPVFATLARIESDLNDLIDALALLSVKRCSQCKKFSRTADPGALFDCGQLVCYSCIPGWWSAESARLGVEERERIEGKLASWLRKHHRAEVRKVTSGNVPETSPAGFQFAAKCQECAGSGKLMEGERCRFCNGIGTVRIVVPN